MTEQRKHHRVPVRLVVSCIPTESEAFDGSVKDISLGGMFVESEQRLAFGSNVTLVLRGVAAREPLRARRWRWARTR